MLKRNLSPKVIYRLTLFCIALHAPQPAMLALNHTHQDGGRAGGIRADGGTYQPAPDRPVRGENAGGRRYSHQVRNSAPEDRNAINAERAFAQANRLRAEWKAQSLAEAIKKYEQARECWRAANNKKAEANALKNIGDVYSTLSQPKNALGYYNQALSLGKAIGDLPTQIESLNSIGLLQIDLGERDEALENFGQALALSRESGNKRGEAQALNNIGLVHHVLSDPFKAIDYFNNALSLWKGAGDDTGRAETLTNLGYVYSDLSNTPKAISFFKEALTLWQATKNIRGQARVLTALGLPYTWSGERQKALDAQKTAAELFRAMGDRAGEAVTLNAKGYIYFTLGEKQKALGCYKQALQLFRELERPLSQAVTIGHIAEIYDASGDKQEALKYYRQKLEIIRTLGDPRAEAYTLRGMGEVFTSMGEKEKALDHFNRALSLSKEANDPRGQAYTLNSMGGFYEGSNDKQKAIELYNRAISLVRAAEDREGERLILHNLSRALRDVGKLPEAAEQLKTLLGLVEDLRTKLASLDMRSSYFASIHQSYELYIDVLMRRHAQDPSKGYSAAALEVSERARARGLLDLLAEARANVRQGIDPMLLERTQDLLQLINSKAALQSRLLEGEHDRERAAAMKKEIDDLLTQYGELESQIKATSPRYAAFTQPQALKPSDIQGSLDADSLLLELSLGSDQSYLWAVTRDSITSFVLPPRAEIEAAAKSVYDLLTARNRREKGEPSGRRRERLEQARASYPEAAARLSRMLLAPVASQLGMRRLIIVADGALHYVPFAALPRPGESTSDANARPLMVDHEIVTLPSVSALALTRQETSGRVPPPKAIAVLADPVLEKDDPRLKPSGGGARRAATGVRATRGGSSDLNNELDRSAVETGIMGETMRFYRLPFALEEAIKIVGFVPKGDYKLAVDFEASHATATSPELGQYRIVHFATHGLLNSLHPELSGIVLSLVDRHGQQQNGFLRLNEVYNLKLPVDLVVLSACQTALGKEIKGEGLVGLTRGFMYAGAARVMASLWKVDDKASSELMSHFYQGVFERKLRPAAALQAAQLAMWKDPRWKEPYYWAAFTLQGEWK